MFWGTFRDRALITVLATPAASPEQQRDVTMLTSTLVHSNECYFELP